jgi:DNA (cytosine-5)-methyltransferase 1
MKILNLFAGIGGNRTLWGDKHEITAVEKDQQVAMIYHKRFPKDKMVIGNAYEYVLLHYKDFDFIWASPPCQSHSKLNFCQPTDKKKLPDMKLFSLIVFLKYNFFGKWVVENVEPYYNNIIKIKPIRIDRHYFWTNFPIKKYNFSINYSSKGGHQYVSWKELCNLKGIPSELIESMDNRRKHIRNAVPPKIGKYIIDSINTTTLEEFL